VIDYREISLEELRNRIQEIDVSEHGTVVYYWIDGALKAIPEEWERPPRTQSSWSQGSWTGVLSLKGVKAWGAFEAEQLVGIVVYRPHLVEQMAQLAALFVSKSHRRLGIASRLAAEVDRQAKMDGHTRLYVSATPSESAVNFYRSQGFTPTLDAHPELYELEPEDIHMVKVL
jgi:GNAT superfamily N-acetyltransferase